MAEYIDRDKVYELIGQTGVARVHVSDIDTLPTVDIDPESLRPVARWEYDPNGMDFGLGAWLCSRCRERNNNIGGSNQIDPYMFVGSKYCPNCGARMVKGRPRGEILDPAAVFAKGGCLR